MAISREEVEHLAELSRIQLRPEELAKYQGELSSILDYVGQLKKADVKKASLAAGGADLKNKWRSDSLKNWSREEVATALGQGEIEDGQVKTKRVL